MPVLAIAAQIPSAEIGRGYFQETNPEQLFRDCSHYCELVSHPEQLPAILELAIRTAIGRRGVSVLVIPGDIALKAYDAPISAPAALAIRQPTTVPEDDQLDALADLLNAGRRITLLCGRGCAGAHEGLVRLGAALQAPMVHALGGKEYVEWDNPFDVGMTGLIGFSSGYHAMLDCDVLLMLGTDFPYRQFYPTDAKIAQVDLRPENLGRRVALDLAIVGDVRATIEALLPRLETKRDNAHLQDSRANYLKARVGLDELATGKSGHGPIHPQYLAKLLSDCASDDAVFSFDVGTPTVWAARYLQMNGKRRLIGSLVHGSMANAMVQAIGAQAAYPGRQVISLSGDGGFAMLMGDLLTLVQQKLPVKIAIFNNSVLGFVALEMKATGFLEIGTELNNPDFAALARAAGLHAIRVEDPGDLERAIKEVLAHDGPALLDVVTNTQELAMPPKIELEQVKGFGLWALRASHERSRRRTDRRCPLQPAPLTRCPWRPGEGLLTHEHDRAAAVPDPIRRDRRVLHHLPGLHGRAGGVAGGAGGRPRLAVRRPVYRRLLDFWRSVFAVAFGPGNDPSRSRDPLLASGAGGERKRQGIGRLCGTRSASRSCSFLAAGAFMAILGVPITSWSSMCRQVGREAAGTALFTLGLTLAYTRLSLSREILFNLAVMLGVELALGFDGLMLKMVILTIVLLSATEAPALSIAHNAYSETAAATTIVSTIFAIKSISVGIPVAGRFGA